MSTSHATLKLFRKIHLYFGIFISPMLLFFAFTGALQTFSLHETTPGSSYKPPAWAVTLGQIHKKQTTLLPAHKQRPVDVPETAKAVSSSPARSADVRPQKSHLPLKIFFLIVAIGLFTSTLTGIYMAFKYTRSKLVVTALLLTGAIIPVLLLPF